MVSLEDLATKLKQHHELALEADSEAKRDAYGAFNHYLKVIECARLLAEMHPNPEIANKYYTVLVDTIRRCHEVRRAIENGLTARSKRAQDGDGSKAATTETIATPVGASGGDDLERQARQVAEATVQSPETAPDWDQVQGMDEAKEAMNEALILPIRHKRFLQNVKGWSGILLYGVPGTGKTMLVQALAKRLGFTFMEVRGADVNNKWLGQGEKIVRKIYEVAAEKQPTILFVDEVDGLLSQRGGDSNHDGVKNAFILAMNGASADTSKLIVTIGATNNPRALDTAMRRRFQRRVFVPMPTAEVRLAILVKNLQKLEYSLSENELMEFATVTLDGYTGSDINNLVRQAAMLCVKRHSKATRFLKIGDQEKYRAVEPCAACEENKTCEFCDSEPFTFTELGEDRIEYDPISMRDLQDALAVQPPSVKPNELQSILDVYNADRLSERSGV